MSDSELNTTAPQEESNGSLPTNDGGTRETPVKSKRKYRTVGDDEFGYRRVLVVDVHGIEGEVVRWTDSCSGCFEFNEGLGLDRYDYDNKHHCYIGYGCDECGYTGKRRREVFVPFPENMEAWDRYITAEVAKG